MTDYLLGIVGIIFLITIAEIILPEGKIGHYLKSIFAIIVLLVVIEPVSKIRFNGLTFTFEQAEIDYQENYLNFIAETKIKVLNQEFTKYLYNKGIDKVDLEIIYEFNDNDFLLKKVLVNLEKTVIIGENKHINIKETVVQAVVDFFNIETKDIVVNE